MQRLHIHVSIENLEQATSFYSAIFGQEPTKLKDDYAKWMLDNPRINFAISTRTRSEGVDHLGIQVDSEEELAEIKERLESVDQELFHQGETTCCYAKSLKAWVKDPAGIPWETYKNMEDVEVFGAAKDKSEEQSQTGRSCC